jgi:hypothetical protein
MAKAAQDPKSSTGSSGVRVWKKDHRVDVKMDSETPVFIPPILLSSYDEFRKFAKDAALVVYTPEYFHSPFFGDDRRLRRVTLSAVGVRIKGVALTFKYILDYNGLTDKSRTWEELARDTDEAIKEFMARLDSECSVVRGTLETESSLGEELFVRP